ncbi:JmjC domain-containing protein [Micromonospora sp. WMMD737]|uniref:JmjC domain-containing protein n=1 Tax=Micromonospora sp. WMMD737 TaxID=3404113 RepID=UPI003B94CA6E
MNSVSNFVENTYEPERFFAEYWRRKPLFVRGGAEGFLGRRWTDEDFDNAHRIAAAKGASIKEQAGEVTFIENVSACDPDLTRRAAGFSKQFASPRAWFDSVRTYSSSGIGAHFDHSDNFVLQQGGVKEWTLASPTNIEQQVIARRMLNLPDVGGHELPEGEGVRFVVEPGDLLYIPLFWLHHGISEAASLSLSLVCPAVSLYSAVVPFLSHAIKEREIGHEPITALHAYLSPDERTAAVAEIRQATADLLTRISDDDMVGLVQSLQLKRLPGVSV